MASPLLWSLWWHVGHHTLTWCTCPRGRAQTLYSWCLKIHCHKQRLGTSTHAHFNRLWHTSFRMGRGSRKKHCVWGRRFIFIPPCSASIQHGHKLLQCVFLHLYICWYISACVGESIVALRYPNPLHSGFLSGSVYLCFIRTINILIEFNLELFRWLWWILKHNSNLHRKYSHFIKTKASFTGTNMLFLY